MAPVRHDGSSLDIEFQDIYNNKQRDLHLIEVNQTGKQSSTHKSYDLYWGVYRDRKVVIKTPKSNIGGDTLERRREELRSELNVMRLLSHPNIIELVAFDDNTIVMERFKYSAVDLRSFGEVAKVAFDTLLALKHMYTLPSGCMRHGNVMAKNIFIHRDSAGTMIRAVLGGMGNVVSCSNERSTYRNGYTPSPTSSDKYDDIISLAITLLNSIWNSVSSDSGIYITYGNTAQILAHMVLKNINPNMVAVLQTMIDVGEPTNPNRTRWIPFIDEIMSTWSDILINHGSGKISSIEPIPGYLNDEYKPGAGRVETRELTGKRNMSRKKRKINMSGVTKVPIPGKNQLNRNYRGIITNGFDTVQVQPSFDDNPGSGSGGQFGISSQDEEDMDMAFLDPRNPDEFTWNG